MIDLKTFFLYFVLSFLTFSGIWLSGSQNFREYVSSGIIPSFTNNTYTEFGRYLKTLNSTHCVEKIRNAGAEVEVHVSSNYYRIDYKLPNMTSVIEVNNLELRNTIRTLNISCEKIENENGWIVKVKNKHGTLEFGFINDSYYENVDGMINRLNWWNAGNVCKTMFESQAKTIQEILNISSCFNMERIS